MKILVTAGNTQTPIDQVRCLTNIFTGRTGARIAREAHHRGHQVTLATSHPESLLSDGETPLRPSESWRIETYRTYDDLAVLLDRMMRSVPFDVVVHAAAVSDFSLAGIFAPAADGSLIDVHEGKVKSRHPELWLKLVPTAKLVDRFRTDWQFRGKLVKFKLEVGIDLARLETVAEQSRMQSEADLMVANTLEGMAEWALVGPLVGKYERIDRPVLARRLLDVLEG